MSFILNPWAVAAARVVALLWALFWLFFFVAESIAWHTPALIMALWVSVGVLFVGLALLPWRREAAGGSLLVIAGLLLGAAYTIWAPPGLPVLSHALTTIAFCGPPLLTGAVFLVHCRELSAGA
jgi:hypothetical protein